MTKREEWCIYAGLLTEDWKQAYLAAHPNTKEDIKPECLYKSVSRWLQREDVKKRISSLGYERYKDKKTGRVQYIWNAVASLRAMRNDEDYPPHPYEPED